MLVLDPNLLPQGFVRGDQFAVALALLDGGRPVLGLLGCPKADRPLQDGALYWAERGHGAFCRAVADGCAADDVPMRVDPLTAAEVRPCRTTARGHAA
eukprot:3817514-Prymnesium_polylepis.2